MAASPPSPDDTLARRKLRLEIRKLCSEIKTTEQTTEFAKGDRCWARWRDGLAIIAGLAPMVAVIVALLTLLWNERNNEVSRQREERRFVTERVEGLTQDNPSVRLASVASLQVYVEQEPFREAVTTALIGALMLEPDVTVRGALLAAIPRAGELAWRRTQDILLIARARLDEANDEARRQAELLHDLRVNVPQDKVGEQIRQAEVAFRPTSARMAALQHAVVALAVAVREFTPNDRCERSDRCGTCRVALGGMYLDGLDLARMHFNLCNVGFEGASLVGAKLSGLDLRDARFQEADLREALFRDAQLAGANFSGSTMEWRRERPLTSFRGAHLTDAGFTKACLSGADLGGSDITAAQLADAYWEGATLELHVSEVLNDMGGPKRGPHCNVPH